MDELLISLVELLSADAGGSDAEALLGRVEDTDELVSLLIHRVFGDQEDDGSLSVLTYLVERNPRRYLARTSRKIRDAVIGREFPFPFITDKLLWQLAKLIVGPDSDTQPARAWTRGTLCFIFASKRTESNRFKIPSKPLQI